MERITELTFLPQFSKNDIPSEWEDYVDSYLRDRYSSKYPPISSTEDEARAIPHAKSEQPPEDARVPSDVKK